MKERHATVMTGNRYACGRSFALLAGLLLCTPVLARAQSTDIHSYALFAISDMRCKGLKVMDVGNVGVNDLGGSLRVHGALLAPNSEISADNVRTLSATKCATLFSNDARPLICDMQHGFASPFASIDEVRAACEFPDPFPPCGGPTVTVGRGETSLITPGSYGDVVVKGSPNAGTLVFDGVGDYEFCSLTVGRNGNLLFRSSVPGRVNVDVMGNIGTNEMDPDLGNGSFTGPEAGSALTSADIHFFANGDMVHFSRRSEIQANLCAPDATLFMTQGTHLQGTFVADKISTEHIIVMTGPAPTTTTTTRPPTTSTTTASTTTTVTTTSTSSTSHATSTTTSTSNPASTTTTTTHPGSTTTTTAAATTTTAAPTTSTSTVTTTTMAGAVCGNEILEAGESCDPPGSLTCPPTTPGGAFTECQAGCLCPGDTTTTTAASTTTATAASTTTTTGIVGSTTTTTGIVESTTTTTGIVVSTTSTSASSSTAPSTTATTSSSTTSTAGPSSTTTTTTPASCGNGVKDPGEECDGTDFGGATCPAGSPLGALLCTASCTIDRSDCHSPTTTTLPRLRAKEICGNCIDDDGDGLTDFEDPDCCAQAQLFDMFKVHSKMKPRGEITNFQIQSTLAQAGLGKQVNPRQKGQDVFVQIRPVGASSDIFCAWVPAKKFMTMHGSYMFWDRHLRVKSAKGLSDMTLITGRNGRLRFRTHGNRTQLKTPDASQLQVTVAFHNPLAGDASNRCSTTLVPFRTSPTGGLRTP